MAKTPGLKALAARINAHLQRMERDPKINVEISRDPHTPKGMGLHRFYGAGAWYIGGRYVSVTYVRYQGSTTMTREQAEIYIAALDAGSTDRHFEVLRAKGKLR